MIKETKFIRFFVMVVCALLYNSTTAFSDDVRSETTTNQNGNTSTEVTSGYASGGSSGGGSSSSNRKSDAEIAAAEQAEDAKAKSEAENVNYSNLYNGRAIFPPELVIHCKMNAEDIAADLSKLEECIKQYVKEMNNDNVAVRTQAIHDYDVMRYQALNDALTNAADKLKSIVDYNKAANQQANATNKSNTQKDTEAALANNQAFATDVINSLRELQAEYLKLQAIDAIRNIDPSAILTEQEYQESKTAVKSGAETNTDSSSSSTDTNIKP